MKKSHPNSKYFKGNHCLNNNCIKCVNVMCNCDCHSNEFE